MTDDMNQLVMQCLLALKKKSYVGNSSAYSIKLFTRTVSSS